MSDYWVSWSEVGFWDRVLDNNLRQRRDINSALADEAVIVDNLAAVTAQLDKLRRTVFEMQVMNTVLLKMLNEAGQLDVKVLKYRVEAELDEIADAKAHAPPPPVTCIRCPNRTTMTGDGVVCDGCTR